MKLLIVTQVIDLDDPILGFFHAWVSKLATHFESIEVICLKEGRHALPGNVRVHSLGKPAWRVVYVARFGWLIWRLCKKYDRVLVHMNPEYVVLGGLDWRLMGKKIFFWYNHPKNDWRLRIATALAHSVFYTSPYAATAKLKKAIRMPAGIDTELFSPQSVPRDRHALYMQGRIMPSKHVEIALEALRLVRKNGTPATLTLVGPEDVAYGTKLRQEFADLVNSNAVTFAGSKPNEKTPALYSAHGVSINLAGDGHYDKSVLESLACETSVVLSSHAFNEKGVAIAPNMFLFKESTPKALSEMVLFVLRDLIGLDELVSRGRDVVIARESLVMLTNKLVKEITP